MAKYQGKSPDRVKVLVWADGRCVTLDLSGVEGTFLLDRDDELGDYKIHMDIRGWPTLYAPQDLDKGSIPG